MKTNKIKIIAHRGASSIAPENTLASIAKALEFSPDFIEIDIRLTKDLKLAVLHDATLRRTTGYRKNIHKITLEEAQQYDAGKWFSNDFLGVKIPSLEEVLKLIGRKAGLMIEIKNGTHPPEDTVNELFKLLKSFSTPLPDLVIGSFSLESTLLAKKHAYEVKDKVSIRTIGIVDTRKSLKLMNEQEIDIIASWFRILSNASVKAIHDTKKEVWSFTVNDQKLATSLAEMGVDGLITNFPQTIK